MDDKILPLLVCPITHSPLTRQGDELISQIGPIRYPIKDGIPILLPEAAKIPKDFTLPQKPQTP